MKRAEFYKLPILCCAGHEHYETLAQLISSRSVLCDTCGQPIEVKDEDRDVAQRVIEDLKRIGPEVDYPDDWTRL